MLHLAVRCRSAVTRGTYGSIFPALSRSALTVADMAAPDDPRTLLDTSDQPERSRSTRLHVRRKRVGFIASKTRPRMTESDEQAKLELEKHPMRAGTILQRHLNNGSLTLNVLCLCLEYPWYLSIRDRWRLERGPTLQRLRDGQLGRTVLVALLQNPQLLLELARTQRSCCDFLAYYVVNENLEKQFYKCLQLPLNEGQYGLHWRGRLLASLCSATFMHGTSASADRPLKTFFEGYEAATSDQDSFVQRNSQTESKPTLDELQVGISHSLFAMRAILGDRHRLLGYPDTDPKLYDQFLALLGSSRSSAFDQAWDIARLHMYHPRNLDEKPAVRLLRGVARLGFPADSRVIRERKQMAQPVCDFIKRAHIVAEGNENHEDSEWILNTFGTQLSRAYKLSRKSAKAEIRTREQTPMLERLFYAATAPRKYPKAQPSAKQSLDSYFWEDAES